MDCKTWQEYLQRVAERPEIVCDPPCAATFESWDRLLFYMTLNPKFSPSLREIGSCLARCPESDYRKLQVLCPDVPILEYAKASAEERQQILDSLSCQEWIDLLRRLDSKFVC